MTNYYEPKYLRGAIRQSIPPAQFFRNRLFPESQTFPTQTVSYEYMPATQRLAPYCGDNIAGGILDRDGYEVRTYRAPLVKAKRVISNDTAAQKLLGESPYNSGMSPEDRAATQAARDIIELQDAITRREEFMCARAIVDGKLAIKGAGINAVVDYGFDGVTETASGDKWSESYDLPGFLMRQSATLAKFGHAPDMLILGLNAAAAFLSNNKLKKLLDLRNVDAGSIKPSELENGVQYLGRIALPGLYCDAYCYSAYCYNEDSGEDEPVVDPTACVMISSRARNVMLYGAVTYVDRDSGEYVSEMDRFVTYTDVQVDPPVKVLYMASRPLPMPKDLTSWLVFKGVC